MEMIILSFFIGVAVTIIPMILGIWYGSSNNRGDSGSNPVPDRKHRSMVRHTTEEMKNVLQVLRLGTCRYEREVVNDIIDLLVERDEQDDND